MKSEKSNHNKKAAPIAKPIAPALSIFEAAALAVSSLTDKAAELVEEDEVEAPAPEVSVIGV